MAEIGSDDGKVYDLTTERDPRLMPTAKRFTWPRALHQETPDTRLQPSKAEKPIIQQIDNPDPWAHDTEPVFWQD